MAELVNSTDGVLVLSAAIVLAAGKGTRVKSVTPKMLLEMCGRTLVGHVGTAVAQLNPTHTVFVVRHEREQIVGHLSEIFPDAIIADQDEVKGTGRAAWCAMEELPKDLTGSVLVVAGDCPMFTPETLGNLVAEHEREGAENAVTVLSTVVPDAHGYGRIVREAVPGPELGRIMGVVEEKDATPEQREIREINTSTYVFDAAFLRESLGKIDANNAQGELYLTDLVQIAALEGKGVGSYIAPDSIEAEGVNDLVQLANLRAAMNRRLCEKWMRTGVHIIDPATTHLDVQVTLEPDAVIEPNTILRGQTHVAAFAHVGPFVELVDADVPAHERVRA